MNASKDAKSRVAFARKLAQKLLKDCCVTQPPVPVEALARSIGVACVVRTLPAGVHGRLRIEGELKTIDVAAGQPKVRQRFSVAHEIGHLQLGHHRDRTEAQEPEANHFAGELLVPRDWLRKDLARRPCPTIDDLAARYDVSTEVLVIAAERANLLDRLRR